MVIHHLLTGMILEVSEWIRVFLQKNMCPTNINHQQGGGFKYFLFSPLLGEDFQFDEHIFQMGGSTTN